MSDLARHVEDYLRLRRALGYKLAREGVILPQLVAYLEAAGAETVTADLVVSWAQLPQGVHPITWSHRLGAARGVVRMPALTGGRPGNACRRRRPRPAHR